MNRIRFETKQPHQQNPVLNQQKNSLSNAFPCEIQSLKPSHHSPQPQPQSQNVTETS